MIKAEVLIKFNGNVIFSSFCFETEKEREGAVHEFWAITE